MVRTAPARHDTTRRETAVSGAVVGILLAAPALDTTLAAVALSIGIIGLFRTERARWERRLLVVTVAAVGAALLSGVLPRPAPTTDDEQQRLEAGWESYWSDLRAVADTVGASISEPDSWDDEARHDSFLSLESALNQLGRPEIGTLLVSPDGVAYSWAGRGLLVEPAPSEIPTTGPFARARFGQITTAIVTPVGDPVSGSREPWRVVVGRSESSEDLPFVRPSSWSSATWSVADDLAGTDADFAVGLDDGPYLLVDRVVGHGRTDRTARRAWLFLGMGLLAAAALRTAGRFLEPPVARPHPLELWLAGTLSLFLGWGVHGPAIAVLGVGGLAALSAWWIGGGSFEPRMAAALGGLGFAGIFGAFWWTHRRLGPFDLAAGSPFDPAGLAIQLGTVLAATSVLIAVGSWRSTASGRPRHELAIASAVALVVGGGCLDRPWLAFWLLVAAGALAGAWVARGSVPTTTSVAAIAVLLTVPAGALSWELGWRLATRQSAGDVGVRDALGPDAGEVQAWLAESQAFFDGVDLRDLTPANPNQIDQDDLAFTLWRRSPLARLDVPSAVVVAPRGRDPIAFSLLLPLTERGQLDIEPARWQVAGLRDGRSRVRANVAFLTSQGRVEGVVRHWMLPRPGATRTTAPPEDPTTELLRGRYTGAARGSAGNEPTFARWSPSGELEVAPWPTVTPVEDPTGALGRRVTTPIGDQIAFSGESRDGSATVYLPTISFAASAERVGYRAIIVLGLLTAAAVGSFLVSLTRAPVRRMVRDGLRSYAVQMLTVYIILLGAPLLLLNATFLKTVEQRLRAEQLAHGEEALAAARSMIGERVLELAQGFVFQTVIDDALLLRASRIVNHDINLFFGSDLTATSKRELFDAGLLSRRVPGEVFRALALERAEIASRLTRAAGAEYVELYAPLRIPGESLAAAPSIFLGVPMLAQQDETARELATLRRRAALTTALVLLVSAIAGLRLSRRFAAPLRALVEGTKQIAAGADSLNLEPSETELRELVDAVDDMAGKIADGRRRLLHEKRVVEQIVESVTAGIVALDAEGRVSMANREGRRLLGVEIGVDFVSTIAEQEELAPVRDLISESASEPREATFRFLTPEGRDTELRVVWIPVGHGEEPNALVVVEDATEVLRSQRLQAWAEMARIIAHEVKNPLTPIRLSTEHLREVWRSDREGFDDVLDQCSNNILTQVEELREIVQEFSAYSQIPQIEREVGDLGDAVSRLVSTYDSSSVQGVTVSFHREVEEIVGAFDERLIRRAVRNLIDNAMRVSEPGGTIEVHVEKTASGARIVVCDRGPGASPETLARMFDPYFSTREGGTGLGLAIARRVAEEHGGGAAARSRAGGGLEVIVTISLT